MSVLMYGMRLGVHVLWYCGVVSVLCDMCVCVVQSTKQHACTQWHIQTLTFISVLTPPAIYIKFKMLYITYRMGVHRLNKAFPFPVKQWSCLEKYTKFKPSITKQKRVWLMGVCVQCVWYRGDVCVTSFNSFTSTNSLSCLKSVRQWSRCWCFKYRSSSNRNEIDATSSQYLFAALKSVMRPFWLKGRRQNGTGKS